MSDVHLNMCPYVYAFESLDENDGMCYCLIRHNCRRDESFLTLHTQSYELHTSTRENYSHRQTLSHKSGYCSVVPGAGPDSSVGDKSHPQQHTHTQPPWQRST